MKVALNSVHPLSRSLPLSLYHLIFPSNAAAAAASQINQTNCLAMDMVGRGEWSIMYSLLWQMENWKWKMGKLAIGEYRAKTHGDWKGGSEESMAGHSRLLASTIKRNLQKYLLSIEQVEWI